MRRIIPAYPREPLRLPLTVLAVTLLLAASHAVPAEDPSWHRTFDFESGVAWHTAPDLLSEFKESQLWASRRTTLSALDGGLKIDTDRAKSGAASGLWANHPRFPTLWTADIPADWGDVTALALWVHSEVATQQIVVLALVSDNPETPWRDALVFPFPIDWTGWRRLVLPLADFQSLGAPLGQAHIQSVHFFTKIFDLQPNPHTVLHLDAMSLETDAPGREAEASPVEDRRAPSAPEDGEYRGTPTQDWHSTVAMPPPGRFNHRFPELETKPPADKPIRYEPYFLAERALFGYWPRFQPGPVSFAPDGTAHIQYGTTLLQTRRPDGTWSVRDIAEDVLLPYARDTLGFDELQVNNTGQANETAIRFDSDGDAYMLAFVSDPTKNWRSRTGLLLHSRDNLATWTLYQLPWYMARFEKFVGHNPDCRQRPPVLLLSQYHAPTRIFITIPEKQTDGTLRIPKPVKIADDALPFIPHSGEANQAVTHGNQVFLVYGRMTVLPGQEVDDGVPAFARTYNIDTGTLSEPVLIGFGGKNAKDNHNWPTIAPDSRGILHVVINGHHNPFRYTHSVRPWDISKWAPTVDVAEGVTYAGLVCDDKDTLYSVSRMSHPGYRFRLALHRKKPGQPWADARPLVVPFKPYYKNWMHKLAIDPATHRLFLFYWAQSGNNSLFRDEFRAYVDIWPHREKPFLSGKEGPRLPVGTGRTPDVRQYEFYRSPPSEPVILVSDDRGETWRLAVSTDF